MSAFLNLAISNLDKSQSLIPFLVKDAFDITGRTVMAQNAGGKHEAREKFIEESGTSLFWIGGIPAVRALANKIVKGKLDTDIHFKRINSEGIQNYYADKLVENKTENGQSITKSKFSKADLEGIVLGGEKLEQVQKKLTDTGFVPNLSKGIYKKFHIATSVAAVGINLFMLSFALPLFNQYLSRKIISKEVKNKASITPKKEPHSGSPSFGSLKELVDFKKMFNFSMVAENAQLKPTDSMLLLDYGISGSRVTFVPRDNNERIEYAVKEGGIILFFYYAADWIKKGFSTLANKAFNVPIDLDYKIITDKNFLAKLKTAQKKEDLLKFTEDKADELNVIKFIDKELSSTAGEPKILKDKVFKNFTLQMAQKSGLIDVEFDSQLKKWVRHSKKYIETDKIIELNNNLKTFYDKAFEIKATPIEKIVYKTKAVKATSVIGNIAICCASLSYVLPKIQYFIREQRTKTNEAPGIKLYQEMAQKKMI